MYRKLSLGLTIIKSPAFVAIALLAALPARADGTVLGVSEGTYSGTGHLYKLGRTVRIPFTSIRTFHDGILVADSTAEVLGFPVKVHARLQFIPSASGFDVVSLEDLDESGTPSIVGNASCGAGTCTFSATLQGGKFELRETWDVRTVGAFEIVSGWQRASGVEMTYDGMFYRQ